MTVAKLMEMIAVTTVPPAALQRHRERGGERPPSSFLFLGLSPRWGEGEDSP
jgi:hypothetical protein